MNHEDIDFQLITDADVTAHLLSVIYSDMNSLILRWSDNVPSHILELIKQLHKELEQC